MDRQSEYGLSCVTDEDTRDIDQAEAEPFNPERPPRSVQVFHLEHLNQVVGQELKLEKDGSGQELLGQDMIDPVAFLQFPDDVFGVSSLSVETQTFE